MAEYWIVSIPKEEKSLSEQKSRVGKLSWVEELSMPQLKFGSLEELMVVSDELVRVESQCENLVHRLVDMLGEVEAPVRDFAWNEAKYPARQSVREMRDELEKEVVWMEGELRGRGGEYNKVKASVEDQRRRAASGLLSRSLYDVVSEDDVVLDSEHLVTLLVVVGKNSNWLSTYSSLTDMVVPESSKQIAEDEDYFLYSVTLFRIVADDFKAKCRPLKFAVRDFEYSRQDAQAYKTAVISAQNKLTALQRPFLNWVKINYFEAFSALLHIKVLRAFIESLLRFGIATPFLLTLLHPRPRNANKLKNVLFDLYAHLDQYFANDKADDLRIPGQTDYYPFPLFKLTVDWD